MEMETSHSTPPVACVDGVCYAGEGPAIPTGDFEVCVCATNCNHLRFTCSRASSRINAHQGQECAQDYQPAQVPANREAGDYLTHPLPLRSRVRVQWL